MEHLPDTDEKQAGSLAVIVDSIGTLLGRVPAVLQQNVAKALGHLFKVPNAYLNGLADELKAASAARVKITEATGEKLAKSVKIDSKLAEIATATHASKILRHQRNSIKILKYTAEEIDSLQLQNRIEPVLSSEQKKEQTQPKEISEDWLNVFESEAINMSSEQMQKLFGKMLAGEICRPSTFSIRTVKLMGQMDVDVAEKFQKFCSVVSSHRVEARQIVVHGFAISLGFKHSSSLYKYGISHLDLMALEEYGLISNIEAHDCPLFFSILEDENNSVKIGLTYNNEKHALIPQEPKTSEDFKDFGTLGIELSRVGRELLSVVDIEENRAYTKALTAYLKTQGLGLCEI